MFPEGTPDLQALLQQAAQMQERLVSAQQDLEEARVEGSSGGGLVHATVSGTGDLIALTIDPSVCDPADPETLADLVVAAVHNAVGNAQRTAADAVGDLTGGFGGDLGASLGALMGGGSPDPADIVNVPGGAVSEPPPSLNVGFTSPPPDTRTHPDDEGQ